MLSPLALPEDVLVAVNARRAGPVVFLTGAGISAESGVPTFRGPEGYWRVGSRNYHPQEMATRRAFAAMPDEVWRWYLHRRAVCRGAEPNAAHMAVATLEARFVAAGRGHDFVLITQNVDGLHLRAGSSTKRTLQIHGNIDFMRCARDCSTALYPIPNAVSPTWSSATLLSDEVRDALRCPDCGQRARPHVLWFDEYYDEPRFHFDSAIRAATQCAVLVVVGTAGQTNLPLQVGTIASQRGAVILAVNVDESPFTELAEQSPSGAFLKGRAGEWVPRLCDVIEPERQGERA